MRHFISSVLNFFLIKRRALLQNGISFSLTECLFQTWVRCRPASAYLCVTPTFTCTHTASHPVHIHTHRRRRVTQATSDYGILEAEVVLRGALGHLSPYFKSHPAFLPWPFPINIILNENLSLPLHMEHLPSIYSLTPCRLLCSKSL